MSKEKGDTTLYRSLLLLRRGIERTKRSSSVIFARGFYEVMSYTPTKVKS
jgi:hypothetical protein